MQLSCEAPEDALRLGFARTPCISHPLLSTESGAHTYHTTARPVPRTWMCVLHLLFRLCMLARRVRLSVRRVRSAACALPVLASVACFYSVCPDAGTAVYCLTLCHTGGWARRISFGSSGPSPADEHRSKKRACRRHMLTCSAIGRPCRQRSLRQTRSGKSPWDNTLSYLRALARHLRDSSTGRLHSAVCSCLSSCLACLL